MIIDWISLSTGRCSPLVLKCNVLRRSSACWLFPWLIALGPPQQNERAIECTLPGPAKRKGFLKGVYKSIRKSYARKHKKGKNTPLCHKQSQQIYQIRTRIGGRSSYHSRNAWAGRRIKDLYRPTLAQSGHATRINPVQHVHGITRTFGSEHQVYHLKRLPDMLATGLSGVLAVARPDLSTARTRPAGVARRKRGAREVLSGRNSRSNFYRVHSIKI